MSITVDVFPKPGEPCTLVTDTEGRKYFFHQVIENKDGDKIGCGCETWPIGWRAKEALHSLNVGAVKDAAEFIEEILREIMVAELQNIPRLHILPVNATISAAGEYLFDAAV